MVDKPSFCLSSFFLNAKSGKLVHCHDFIKSLLAKFCFVITCMALTYISDIKSFQAYLVFHLLCNWNKKNTGFVFHIIIFLICVNRYVETDSHEAIAKKDSSGEKWFPHNSDLGAMMRPKECLSVLIRLCLWVNMSDNNLRYFRKQWLDFGMYKWQSILIRNH